MTFSERATIYKKLIMLICAVLVFGNSDCSAKTNAADPATFALTQQPVPVIVIGEGALPSERFAVEELTTYLQRITGQEFSIRVETEPVTGPLIAVGKSKHTGHLDIAALEVEDHIIEVGENRLVIVGGRKPPLKKKKSIVARAGCDCVRLCREAKDLQAAGKLAEASQAATELITLFLKHPDGSVFENGPETQTRSYIITNLVAPVVKAAAMQMNFENPSQIEEISNDWGFSTDPENVGIAEQWFAPDFDDSQWPRIISNQYLPF